MRLTTFLTLLLTLAFLASPAPAQQLRYPRTLIERAEAAKLIIVARVGNVATRDAGDILTDLAYLRELDPTSTSRRDRFQVPRIRAEVTLESVLKGSTPHRNLAVLFGYQGNMSIVRSMRRNARVLLFLRERSPNGPWAALNDPYGVVGFPGEDLLEDGTTITDVKNALSELATPLYDPRQ